MALTLEEVARRFEKATRRGDGGYQVVCPCHTDKEPSLSISCGKDREKIVLHCHAGCDTKEILQEVGLSMTDIGEDRPEITWQTKLEKWMNKKVESVYDYQDEYGKYIYSKVRFEGKQIRYGVLDQAADRMDLSVKGLPRTLYNLPALLRSISKGYEVYIVEGEKDVETVKRLGLTATTAGSVSDWRKEYAHFFTGARVTILPDNDDPGRELAARIKQDLRDWAHSIRVVQLPVEEKGDVTDYIEAGNTKEDLKAVIATEKAIVAPWIFFTGSELKPVTKINEDILAQCILRTADCFFLRSPGVQVELAYFYDGGVYRRKSKSEIKAMVRKRVPFGIGKDDIFGKVANLLTYSGDRIYGMDDIDNDEWIINVKNGLYDVKTGKLRPHDSKVLSTIQLNCSYPAEYKEPPAWTQFVMSLCSDEDGKPDIDMYFMLQEWAGAAISNIKMYRFKKALALHSPAGNTGKSVFLNVLSSLVGYENVANVPIQRMADRWSVGEIYGKRLVMVGDQNAEDIEDSSIFKQLTGGDMVKAEFKGQMAFGFIFKGAINFACNDLPSFKDDKGDHIFDRLLLAPCRNVIPPEKRDKHLLDKLLQERDQIFRWAMEGLQRLLENNMKFTECGAAKSLMEEYRGRLDSIYRFLDDNCIMTGASKDRIRKMEFEDEYIQYCQKNDIEPLKRKNIKTRMAKNNVQVGFVDGKRYYKGVAWKDFRTIYDPER